jgi:3-isopropylmalate dehydratase small subunit
MENPESELEIDLEAMVVRAGGGEIPCGMPEGDRLLLVTGQWDTTGMLLGNVRAIRGAARRIPYLRGFRTH